MLKLLTKSKNASHSCLHIFSASIFYAFHYYFILYINSSYLEMIMPRSMIGILYAVASALTILILYKLSRIIERIGILKTFITLSLVDIASLSVIVITDNVNFIIPAFLVYLSLPVLMIVCLDTAIEDTAEAFTMGKTRGIFLTVLATASVLSPLAIGGMVAENGFKQVYLFSLFFLCIFLLVIIINRDQFTKAKLTTIKGFDSIKEFLSIPNIRRIGIINFALQFFFSWLVIYIPIYLSTKMGFSWEDIGIIISITLLPFVILEIPAGELADNVLGEKEMLLGGMIFMIIASLLFPALPKGAFMLWTLVILLGRIGASIMETMVESYFFKKSEGKDELIEVFRMTQPLAYIAGPLVGSVMLLYVPFAYIFPILAVVLLGAMLPAMRIENTK
ncbi:MAG: major facilitator superfamily transporter [Candidatus Taylorbacteria bacterium]|nr:major facilitator superfamily transporter [Candidatus Taylorbacteria bacterium]